MDCKTCRVEIEEAEQGAPVGTEAAAHLAACAGCRAFRHEQAALRKMVGSLEVVTAPADFDFRLRARLAVLKSEERAQTGWSRFAPGARALALAASVAILLAAGLVFQQVWLAPESERPSTEVAGINPPENFVPPATAVNTPPVEGVREDRNSTPERVNPGPVTVAVSSPSSSKQTARRAATTPRRAEGEDSEIDSRDFAVGAPANSLTPLGIPLPQPNVSVAVPLEATTKSARVILDDGHAGPQTVSLRPVSFGAESVIEQPGQRVLISNAQGVW